MSNLLLDNWQSNTAVNYVVHDVAMSQRMDGEHPQAPTANVFAIHLLQTGPTDIALKYLSDTILRIWLVPPFSMVE